MAEALFSGVDLVALTFSTSWGFLALVDSKCRLAVEGAAAVVVLAVERRTLPLVVGLLMLIGAGPVELLRLRFKEEFNLPEKRDNTCMTSAVGWLAG